MFLAATFPKTDGISLLSIQPTWELMNIFLLSL